MSFAEFRQFATEHALESLDKTHEPDASEEKIRGRFAEIEFDRIPKYQSSDFPEYSERSFFSGLLDVLNPYSMMRLEAHEPLSKLTLPKNMRGAMLPQLTPFRKFLAQGPEGLAMADINHRAAAIECYLDLNLKGRKPAQVQWTNYKTDLGVYHGVLDYKDYRLEERDRPRGISITKVQYTLFLLSRLTVSPTFRLRESGRLRRNIKQVH
jgi:HEPN/Toprim N-terminal domain 1